MTNLSSTMAVPKVVTPTQDRSAERPTIQTDSPLRQVNAEPGKGMPPARIPDRGQLEQAVKDMNAYVQGEGRSLRFNVDDDTGRIIVKVLDEESDEVIRQIPPEEMLALAKSVEERTAEGPRGFLVHNDA